MVSTAELITTTSDIAGRLPQKLYTKLPLERCIVFRKLTLYLSRPIQNKYEALINYSLLYTESISATELGEESTTLVVTTAEDELTITTNAIRGMLPQKWLPLERYIIRKDILIL